MLLLKQLFRFYVNASIHVALSVVALYVLNAKTLNIPLNFNLAGFLFFATIVCYNFVKYGVEADKYLIVAKPSHKPIQIFSFISFAAALWFLVNLGRLVLPLLIVLTLISVFYVVPLSASSKNLRSVLGLKVIIVAFEWTGFTVLLPLLEVFQPFNLQELWVSLSTFLLVIVLMIPFEIRDLKYDKPELRTLPQRFGIRKTKAMGYVLCGLYLIFSLLAMGWNLGSYAFSILTTILLMFALYKTKEVQSAYFASLGVEALPIFFLVLKLGIDYVALELFF